MKFLTQLFQKKSVQLTASCPVSRFVNKNFTLDGLCYNAAYDDDNREPLPALVNITTGEVVRDRQLTGQMVSNLECIVTGEFSLGQHNWYTVVVRKDPSKTFLPGERVRLSGHSQLTCLKVNYFGQKKVG